MIEIFVGEDTQSARHALHKALEGLGTTEIQWFTDIGFDPQQAYEAVYARSLFGTENIVIFDGIIDSPLGADFYTLNLKDSPNNLYIREIAPNKDILKILQKLGNIQEFQTPRKVKFENSFAIADAMSVRDKRIAWIEYVRAKERGSVAEEIHGTIFWATKILYLCATCDKGEAVKSGVSQYNYQKYLLNSKKFLLSELEERLRILKDMYHLAHRGEGEFDAMLEQYILKV